MTGVDSSELILLLIIGLIVLGPKRLPEIANRVGRWVGQARRMTRAMRRQLEEELNFDEDKNIGGSNLTPPSVLPGTPDPDDPANPEYDADEPQDYVPQDDDTYSPLHADEAGEPVADDDVVGEKRA